MRTSIDAAGRLVVPKQLRDRIGLISGPVEVTVVGSALVLEPVASDELVDDDGLLVLGSGVALGVDEIRELRLGDQR